MKISLITPAPEQSRAGNRTTALRWAGLLRDLGHAVRVAVTYDDEPADMLVALHAWHSAGSIARFHALHPTRPLVVALTGTDIYQFLNTESLTTLRSLEVADGLVGLHDLVADAIPARYHDKLTVIVQSAVPLSRAPPPLTRTFEIAVIGHLRAVKDPMRAAEAARLLPAASRIRVVHLGRAIDATWEARATAEMRDNPRYDWRGEVPGWMVRQRLARAKLMVLSSIAEGGANVISEAVVAGVPVVASDIAGSVGLLGKDYPGYYPVGDTAALAALMRRAEGEPAFLKSLRDHGAARASSFAPAREREAWRVLIARVGAKRGAATKPPAPVAS